MFDNLAKALSVEVKNHHIEDPLGRPERGQYYASFRAPCGCRGTDGPWGRDCGDCEAVIEPCSKEHAQLARDLVAGAVIGELGTSS